MLTSYSADSFAESQVSYTSQEPAANSNRRSSMSAPLLQDNIVSRVLRRASALQGYKSLEQFEPLQVVKYNTLGQYKFHYDWQIASYSYPSNGNNRDVSIFVYLSADCEGGNTYFPHVLHPANEGWCKWIECSEESDNFTSKGTTFKPIPGNAILWFNLNLDSSGNDRTGHASLPVTQGVKLGLNIWSRDGKQP